MIEKDDLELPHNERVQKWGHRTYVGGSTSEMWYGIGKRQYHFLVSRGLKPEHSFLDIACGSLRLGQFLIPMLNKGNYFGIEGEKGLVDLGIQHEILFNIIEVKNPVFMFNYNFNFSQCKGYDFAIAQSLFTHLTIKDIKKCFTNLYPVANDSSMFFFTFFEGDESKNEHIESHANKNWYYEFNTLKNIGESCGFCVEYIGDWGHERNQMMAVARKF